MPNYCQMKNRSGQSTIEYILVVAGVIAAVLIFLGKNGIFQNTLNATYNMGIDSMLNVAERILE